jgi:putative effector of murein hydrolase/putative effector of murein hydrolase LrgA (UPF0299 family)
MAIFRRLTLLIAFAAVVRPAAVVGGVALARPRLHIVARPPLCRSPPRAHALASSSYLDSLSSPAPPASPPPPPLPVASDAAVDQTVAELKHARRTLGSVLLLFALNRALARATAAAGIAFPPSLIGMALVFGGLCAASAADERAAAVATGALRPGVVWLTRWMPVFFAPALVSLPAALAPIPVAELVRLPFLIVGGYTVTTVTTALVVKALPAGRGSAGAAPAAAMPPPPCARKFVPSLLAGTWASTGLALLCSRPFCALPASHGLVQAHCLALLWCAYTRAEALPAKAKAVVHPTLLAGAATWLALVAGARALAPPALGASPAAALVSAFGARSGGGGGALLGLLPLTVLGFGLQLYDRRAQLRAAAPRIGAAVGAGALTGVVGTALACRALGLSAVLSRSLLTRTITAPLAQLGAVALGGSPGLAVATTVLSGVLGANCGRNIFARLRVDDDAVVVGLAMGTGAHGLGTAALADWPEALAFSALALALNGLVIATLLASPLGGALVTALLGA